MCIMEYGNYYVYNGVWENKDEQHMVPALKELRRM